MSIKSNRLNYVSVILLGIFWIFPVVFSYSDPMIPATYGVTWYTYLTNIFFRFKETIAYFKQSPLGNLFYVVFALLALAFTITTLIYKIKRMNRQVVFHCLALLCTTITLIIHFSAIMAGIFYMMNPLGIIINCVPIIIIITSATFFAIELKRTHAPPRRPSKTAALEARVAELEQQVDELKNKD